MSWCFFSASDSRLTRWVPIEYNTRAGIEPAFRKEMAMKKLRLIDCGRVSRKTKGMYMQPFGENFGWPFNTWDGGLG